MVLFRVRIPKLEALGLRDAKKECRQQLPTRARYGHDSAGMRCLGSWVSRQVCGLSAWWMKLDKSENRSSMGEHIVKESNSKRANL